MNKLVIFLFSLLFSVQVLAVSFSRDITPIFEAKCNGCHNENWADHNWRSYAVTVFNAAKIQKVVLARTMPPANIKRLTDKERVLIYVWIKQGTQP